MRVNYGLPYYACPTCGAQCDYEKIQRREMEQDGPLMLVCPRCNWFGRVVNINLTARPVEVEEVQRASLTTERFNEDMRRAGLAIYVRSTDMVEEGKTIFSPAGIVLCHPNDLERVKMLVRMEGYITL